MLLQRNPEILAVQTDSELVMLDAATGRYHHLNETATAAWQLLESPRTLADLCDTLGRSFAGDSTRIRSDVEAFVRKMVEMQLLSELETDQA